MYPFWDPVVAPLVERSEARRIVEIGALRGETTIKMLGDLGPEAELHVIDPLPQFDPAEHEQAFPGRYIFHRDLSLNVLPDAPAFDVALIDGDHNWYTVYHELQHLRRAARDAGAPVPLCILHDIGWPYGRRDLYYEPSQIPEEFRQPYDRRGMAPGRTELLDGWGMNIGMANALEEGGPRNGVRTGLDDWLAEHDTPIRQVILPIYYGLAIVAEEAYLDAHPAVAEFLDELESHQGTQQLLGLSEDIRLDEAVFTHDLLRVWGERTDRANNRYLSLLRGSLVDEHYIDNEHRIGYLLDCIAKGHPVDPETLRTPSQRRAQLQRGLAHAKEAGSRDAGHFAYTDMGRLRLEQLDEALGVAHADTERGDLVEVGCGRGGGAIYMRGYLSAHEIPRRRVLVADEFRARPRDGGRDPLEHGTSDLRSDLNQVREGFDRFDLLDRRVRFFQGEIDETLPAPDIGPIALLRVGPTVDAAAVLGHLYDRVVPGGVVIVDTDEAGSAAVEAFRSELGATAVDQVGWEGVAWQKLAPAVEAEPSRSVRKRAPLAPTRRPVNTIDLSIVVVFHNMKREAKRTLHSLTRGYQRGIEDLNYEVIALDNGSDPGQKLDAAFVESFGPEFRFVDMGADAPPSPTHALNVGIGQSRGANLALMIDGAHVLTPGVISHALAGLGSYGPAVVATQQWYVGPGQQPEAVALGYDQAQEDKLFESISWPDDGYRLFEVGHFVGERDWFDGMIESNCLFAPRSLLEQVGGFDDSFSMPGGGYANLELYERLGSHPGVTLVTIIGEGSFHQVHGGTTTNVGERDARRAATFSYGEHYADKWGKTLHGPARHLHFVGSFASGGARRTRARRLTAMGFGQTRTDEGIDGIPDRPQQMPDEIVLSFIDAYWHSLAWRENTWLGDPVDRAPTDLFVLQELISKVRPDHVVVTTDSGLGFPRFLAGVCELLGHGVVVAVGKDLPETTDAPRLVTARDNATAVAAVGDDPNALVILSARHGVGRLVKDFEQFEGLVRPGSYVVMENTIVNGHPVWPGFGTGPLEAVRQITRVHGDFLQDTELEYQGLCFNRGGFLRRSE